MIDFELKYTARVYLDGEFRTENVTKQLSFPTLPRVGETIKIDGDFVKICDVLYSAAWPRGAPPFDPTKVSIYLIGATN